MAMRLALLFFLAVTALAQKKFWAFQPLEPQSGSIDEILKPTGPPVGHAAWMRRVSFSLIGLPPTDLTETARAATAAGFVETGEAPAAIPAPAVSRPRCPDRDTAAPRTESCRAGALVAPASEALAPPDPDESADAMGIDAIAAPTPNATANAPTRPM